MQASPGLTQIPQLPLQHSQPSLQTADPHVCPVGHGKNSQLLVGFRLTKDPSLHSCVSSVHPSTRHGTDGSRPRALQIPSSTNAELVSPFAHCPSLQQVQPDRSHSTSADKGCSQHLTSDEQRKNSQLLLGSRPTTLPSGHCLASLAHSATHGLDGYKPRPLQTSAGVYVGPLFPVVQ